MSQSRSSLDTETLVIETAFQNKQIEAAGLDLKGLARKNSNSLSSQLVVPNMLSKI